MTGDLKEAKKIVAQEWQSAFPQLIAYSQDKLYKIIGPIVSGIELIKLPRTEEYRPHFVIYPLWKNDVKACLEAPIVLKEYYDKKCFQFSIPYEKHIIYFEEVLKSVREQTPLLFTEDISIENLFDFIDNYSNTPPLNAAPNSFFQARLQEIKLEIALCIGNNNGVNNAFAEIQKREWNIKHFVMCNIDIHKWLHNVEEKVNRSEELLNRIAVNKKDKKLKKLKQTELKG